MKKIKEGIEKLIEVLVDQNVKKTLKEVFNLNFKYKILFILLLPLTSFFIFMNIIVIIISICYYFSIFFFKYFKVKIFKKKTKNIIYKKRFKFLKNFYLIIIEKILISYPKQKAFLIFYIVSKSIYEKDKSILQKEYIPEFLRSISNRIVIFTIFSLPFIVIYCNNCLVKIIKELDDFNYESKIAYFNTIFVNILKNLTNDYSALILKLKIKFYKKKIIFNSKKDLIKALFYKKEFGKNFNINKKNLKYAMAKQKISENKYSKEHFTALDKLKNGKIMYLNETTTKDLSYQEYFEKLDNYSREIHKNMYKHKGTINEKKTAYYTPNILTEKEKIIIVNPQYNNKFINLMKEEKLNNIIAAYSLNLDQIYLENKFLEIGGVKKEILVKNIELKKTIDYYKQNKEFIETEQYESILGMNFFWNENEKIIRSLSFNEKMDLCYDLNIEFDASIKEINFQIFNNVMNKK